MTLLRASRGFWSAEVTRAEFEGRPAVLKEYRRANLLARRLVRREFEILRQLEGISGIPRVYRIVDRRALLLEYVEGKTFSKFRAGDLADSVFHRLCRLVRDMHERGVVHLDLRQKKNILVTPQGQPFLVDFAGALRRSGPARAVWNHLVRIDESALLKFKLRNFPHLVTEEDREALRRHRRIRRFWIFTPRSRYAR